MAYLCRYDNEKEAEVSKPLNCSSAPNRRFLHKLNKHSACFHDIVKLECVTHPKQELINAVLYPLPFICSVL